MTDKVRCAWAGVDPLYVAYHDEEWGMPLYDDRALFELLILEGAQAGLSWLTVLKKREHYREAFDHFDAEKVARYGEEKIAELLANPGIVRNRLKVRSAVKNAQATLRIREEFGGFHHYLWRFVDGRPIQTTRLGMDEVPARSKESDALSKDLIQRDCRFVGSTICYALMQASGLVNDHLVTCFRRKQVTQAMDRTFK